MNSQNEVTQILGEALSDIMAMKCRIMALEFQIQKAIAMLEPEVIVEYASKSDGKSIMAEDSNINLEMGYK